MKKLAFLVVLAFLSVPLKAQICQGDVVLTTQAEVDAFACDSIQGTLLITGSEIRSLLPLQKLKMVDEHVLLADLNGLETLEGLENLKDVSCSFEIKNCNLLTDLTGTSGLSTIGRNLTVLNCDNLVSLNGLGTLTSLMNLNITGNPRLADCCILQDYAELATGWVYVENNAPGCSLEELAYCGTGERVCVGDILITSQAEMDAFNCNRVIGNLTIQGYGSSTDPITNTNPLSSLAEITGDLTIDLAEEITGLQNLKSAHRINVVGGSLDLSSLEQLEALWGIDTRFTVVTGAFPKLSGTLEYVAFETLTSLENPLWMGNIDHVNRLGIDLTNSIDLKPSFQLLRNGGSLFMLGVTDFDGLQHIDSLSFLDMQYVRPPTFDQLSGLIFADTLIVRDLFEFPDDYCGLYPVLSNRNASSVFRWENNAIGFNEILVECGNEEVACKGDMRIYTQQDADNFYCSIVDGDLYLQSEEVIDTENLSRLTEVTGDFYFSDNGGNISMNGLRNLERIGGTLELNPKFFDQGPFDLNDLPSLSYVRHLSSPFINLTGDLPRMQDTLEYLTLVFSGFEPEISSFSVPAIDSIILIYPGGQVDFLMEKLTEGGFLYIDDMYFNDMGFKGLAGKEYISFLRLYGGNLPSFEGLEDLKKVDEMRFQYIDVTDNNCCGLFNFITSGIITKSFYYDNVSCTVEEIVASCAPPEVLAEMSVYPNPVVSNSIDVEWQGIPNEQTTVQIIDNFGKEVRRQTVSGATGRQHLQLEISGLQQGYYLIRIVTGDDVQLRRLIRQ